MNEAVIVLAKRTAIGSVGGIFRHVPPEKLGAAVVSALLEETGVDPRMVDEVIFGNAIGPGGNLARLIALTAHMPEEVPGVTIDRQCGSGLEAVNLACRLVQAGAGSIYIAGGVESSSLAPWKIEKPRSLYETPSFYERARFSPDFIGDPDMGLAADRVATVYGVSREAQDLFAYESHAKAVRAQRLGLFHKEIVPVNGQKDDEGPRANLKKKTLARMRPVFSADGTVTAGNACAINDGAAAVLVMSEAKCQELGLTPTMRFVDAVSAGVDPNLLGIGPIPAVKNLLRRVGKQMDEIDLFEFNEAFASQVLASVRELKIPKSKLNINGGALAFGHPYGASGAILVTRLFSLMQESSAKRAIATLGIGGGIGLASLFEKYEPKA